MKQYSTQPDNSNWVDRSPIFDAALKVLFGLCIISVFYLKKPFTMEQLAQQIAAHPVAARIFGFLIASFLSYWVMLLLVNKESGNTGDNDPILDHHEEMISK